MNPRGERTIDLTWWLAAGGIGLFLVLLVAAVVLYTINQLAQLSITPTAIVAIVPTSRSEAQGDTGAPQAGTGESQPRPSAGPLIADTPTLPPSPTATLSPTPSSTPTPAGTPTPVVYVVKLGDTLGGIALAYGVSIEEIQAANPDIANPDQLFVGQTLVIPFPTSTPPPPTATLPPGTVLPTVPPTAPVAVHLPRSILEGDLNSAYPLAIAGSRVTLHYQPGSFADLSGPQTILANAEESLAKVEQMLGVAYAGPLDLYLAGSLFAAPNQALRQRDFPNLRRAFILYDGSGTPAERRYLLAHEITRVVSWHTLGVPDTVMLSQGLAGYIGQLYLEQGGYLKNQDICRALARTSRLPSVSGIENITQEFIDPVRNLYNYQTAACFVAYLFERGGAASFAKVYSTSAYAGAYGAVLEQLQIDFERNMSSGAFTIPFDPDRFVNYYEEVRDGYVRLFADADPNLTAYDVLDDARTAVLTGNLDGARALLDQFHLLVK